MGEVWTNHNSLDEFGQALVSFSIDTVVCCSLLIPAVNFNK